jgi:hypothetical protein
MQQQLGQRWRRVQDLLRGGDRSGHRRLRGDHGVVYRGVLTDGSMRRGCQAGHGGDGL